MHKHRGRMDEKADHDCSGDWKATICKHAQYATNTRIQLFIGRRWIDGELKLVQWGDEVGLAISGDYSIPEGVRQYEYPDVRGHDGSRSENRGIETIGMDQAINDFKAKTPDWNKGSDRTVAERLVNVEINDPEAKKYVGAPTSTVVVTKSGIKWTQRGACK